MADNDVNLPELDNATMEGLDDPSLLAEEPVGQKVAAELEAVFDVPVQVTAILGRAHMHVSELLKVGVGTVIELDRRVGEAIDIFVNNRLVARGEVVLVDEQLGITMTEIIKADRV